VAETGDLGGMPVPIMVLPVIGRDFAVLSLASVRRARDRTPLLDVDVMLERWDAIISGVSDA
jgi:hypothetical protein